MLSAKIQFGSQPGLPKDELEDLAETYLAAMFHTGQLCGEYFLTWIEGFLHAHVLLACSQARQPRYHSVWGRNSLAGVIRAFGQTPQWTLIDDDAKRRSVSWKRAPFLYLFTNAFDWDSPVRRGDNGKAIPVCLLPIPFEQKGDLYHWKSSYFHHDNIWLGCGALEVPSYRQMADAKSELAEEGRDLCREIEQATGVPTFYYLHRFWGRKKGEEERRCPICAGRWWSKRPATERASFWQFDFRCDRCRLVSHFGVSNDGGRHTKIGEFQGPNRETRQSVRRLQRGHVPHSPNPR